MLLCYNEDKKWRKVCDRMKILFFDMEFANGKVPGSIYSIGYLVTDENFEILVPPTDLIMNPDAPWNEYVEQNILAYPKDAVENAPAFPAYYERVKELLESADVAVGFAVSNDVRALRKNCERYGLPQLRYRAFDTERLCRLLEEHREVRGLGNCVAAWCGEQPDNRHRSDGDALATMMLLRAVCKQKHVTPEMLLVAYPSCLFSSVQPQRKRGGQGKRGGRAHAPNRKKASGHREVRDTKKTPDVIS